MATTFPRGAAKALATVTRPSKGIFLLSMHNESAGLLDNRLTPNFIKDALLPALDHIELEFREARAKGDGEAALVFTGERVKNKFFSNGLSLDLVVQCPGFFKDYYYTLMSRLLTFPMHTVAAINGHYYAGGFCLAQCADWRVLKEERAWGCMNEVDFGAPLPIGMASVLKQRLDPLVLSKVMLSGHRYGSEEALAVGIVDELVKGDGEAVIARAIEVAEQRKKHAASGVLSLMKTTLYAEVLKGLQTDEGMVDPNVANDKRLGELRSKL